MRSLLLLPLSLLCIALFLTEIGNAQLSENEAVAPVEPTSIIVLVSTSMTEVMSMLAREYAKQSDITVSVTFRSSEELAQSIESGDPADVFISEDANRMTTLKQQGVLDVYSISELARNTIVLVAARGHHINNKMISQMPLEDILANITKHTILHVGDPDIRDSNGNFGEPFQAPVGKYAKQAITTLGYWDAIYPLYLARSESSRNALYLIAKGKTAGIVYNSDAHNNPEVTVLSAFPSDLHDPITYQGAVIAGDNMDEARAFLTFLQSDSAKTIFKNHGFGVM